ncbi:hypothetical protein GGF43_001653 [Coemansia sp. RSA 2618]|nr:hypothetical protein GGF43_001653 [Coemansia sp. RSA 2618]
MTTTALDSSAVPEPQKPVAISQTDAAGAVDTDAAAAAIADTTSVDEESAAMPLPADTIPEKSRETAPVAEISGDGGTTDKQPSIDSVTRALEDTSIVDASQSALGAAGTASPPMSPGEADRVSRGLLSPGMSRTSTKAPATSHPLQGSSSESAQAPAGMSPAEVASAILLKEGDTSRAYGSGAASGSGAVQGSGESERTAFSPPMRNSASPASSRSMRGIDAEIAEASDDEDYEDKQRRLFKAAERRRLQKEQISQNNLSSDDIQIMRSGLSNAREYINPSELRVLNGSFPDGLRGSMYLLGPGQMDIKYNVQRELEQATRVFTYGNIMDALPLLTKISFDPTSKTIVHRSRLIAKQAAGRIHMEHGVNTKVPGALYLTDTNQTVLSKFIPKASHHATPEGECCSQGIQLFMPLQGSSQTVVCTNHVGALQNIDPVDLRPRSTVDFKTVNSAFSGALSCPHMQYDSDAREHFTVLQDVGFRSTTYNVVCISETQPEGYVVASFTAQASVLHSFAITQDYVIVPVYPYDSPLGGMSYRWSDSLLETLSFDHSQPVLFYVISREYRRVQCVYQAPAFFALHQINAVQETVTDSVAVDMVTYEDDTILRRMQIKDLRKSGIGFPVPAGVARRFQLNGITLEATKYVGSKGSLSLVPPAHSRILRNEPVELCRINPIVATRPYTYLYGLGHADGLRGQAMQPSSAGSMYNCIVKLNINDSSEKPLVWSRTHCYPSEPVFVPRNDKEDDGYVLSVFFDSMRITSCLVVLDAATFNEVLIAQLPAAMPMSFGHAKFAI